MVKKIIAFVYWFVGFACASLLVEGAAIVQHFQDVSQFPSVGLRENTI